MLLPAPTEDELPENHHEACQPRAPFAYFWFQSVVAMKLQLHTPEGDLALTGGSAAAWITRFNQFSEATSHPDASRLRQGYMSPPTQRIEEIPDR